MMQTEYDLNPMAQDIFANNVKAGWWTNLETGESTISTRSRPEMLMLVTSELAEAYEGQLQCKLDDHLPDLPMEMVELADTAIRLMDLIAAEEITINPYVYKEPREDFNLMDIVLEVSRAMEGYRKSNTEKYEKYLVSALYLTYDYAGGYEILNPVINRKVEYNKNRADHKISNRVKSGGKKF